jgi:hypothetical protein
VRQPPARLTAEQAAVLLNFQPWDVRILVATRLLKPLGNPLPNSVKYFSVLEVLEQVKDRTWLSKVTNALNLYWQRKNTAKHACLTQSLQPMLEHSRAVPAQEGALDNKLRTIENNRNGN